MAINILVAEGNAEATSETMRRMGIDSYGESYARLLKELSPHVECEIVFPSEKGPDCLPDGKSFDDYRGVVLTGSAMSCYEDRAEVHNQRAFAETAFHSGTSVFGSCWGLQIMTVALGGKVGPNPNGREIGISTDITLTQAGTEHPMYNGRSKPFEAFSVHLDEVTEPATGSAILAGNETSAIQGLAIERDQNSFWGAQYHPEFDFAVMACTYRRLSPLLVEEGLYRDPGAVERKAKHFDQKNELSTDLSRPRRHNEILNWLSEKVLPLETNGA